MPILPSSASSSSSSNKNTVVTSTSNNNNPQMYPLQVQGQTFCLSREHKVIKKIGEGAFGCVIAAEDVETKEKVAIKKITPVADEIFTARRTLREIMIMRLCSDHPNIISLRGLCINRPQDELYIFMELMFSDLFKILSNVKVNLDQTKVITKQILYGLAALRKIGVIHRDIKPGNILVTRECQVKLSDFGLARFTEYNLPSSKIMTSPTSSSSSTGSTTSSRIISYDDIDLPFGETLVEGMLPNLKIEGSDDSKMDDHDDNEDKLRMKIDNDNNNNDEDTMREEETKSNTNSIGTPNNQHGPDTNVIRKTYEDGHISVSPMTDYVVTRWYRSPELILSPQLDYNDRVDTWAVGCILAEMIQGRVLFQGNSSPDQLRKILRVQGCPPDFNFGYELHPDAITFLRKEPKRKALGLQTEVNKASVEAIELLEGLLIMDPAYRWSASQAINHSFLNDCPDIPGPKLNFAQWSQDVKNLPCNISFERNQTTLETVRNCLEAEIHLMDISDVRSPKQVQESRRRSIGFNAAERRPSISNYQRRRSSTHSPYSDNGESSLTSGQIKKQPIREEGKDKDDGDYKMEMEREESKI